KLESSISKIKETFEKPFKELLPNLLNILSVESQELFKTDLAKFKSFGLSDLLATTLSVSPFIASLFEVIWISNQSGQKLNQISELYNSINTLMGLEDVLHQLENFSAPNKWDQLLLSKSKVQIRKSVCKLVIKAAETKQKDISFWLSQNSKVQKSREIAADLKTHGISIAGIAIISEELNSND
ncbi:MAG: NAD-glutamate dehydrogenase, partial [bacterium]|nr:NAD-glutamate dehydrogenase [bacterium]